ncbi:MAG: hypothetical protein AAGG38_00960 [Planctomycetota bacterium]
MSDELNFNAPQGNSNAGARDEDSSQRRAQLLALLRGRLHWAIILSVIFGSVFAYFGHQSVVPMFESSGSVVVQKEEILFDASDVAGNNTGKWRTFLRQQDQLIKSAQVAERAMASEVWQSRSPDAPKWSASDFARAIETEMDEGDDDNNVFDITFSALDGESAGKGNQALLQAYREEYGYQTSNQYLNLLQRLQNQMQKSAMEIKEQEAQRRIIMTDTEYQQLIPQINALNNQQIDLQFKLDEVRAELELRNPAATGVSTNPADLIVADPILSEMQENVQFFQDQIDAAALNGMGPNHPTVARYISSRDVIKAKMEKRIEQMLSDEDGLLRDQEYEQLRQLEQLWHRQLVDVNESLDKLGTKRAQVAGIEEEIEAKRLIINKARREIDEINVELDGVKNTVRILSLGAEPLTPSNSGKAMQVAVLGSMGGTFLGFGLVMAVGLLDRRLRHAGDARMGLRDIRMLGILPTLPENFADPEQSEKAAHAVHHIRTLLQISNRGTARVFSVTSPAAGSGKSSLSVAMGLSFAASESKTLVIDCDLVGAGLTRRVGAVVNRSVEAILREDTVLTDDQINDAVRHAREKGVKLKDALVELGMLTKKDLQRLNRRQADSALGILDACQGRPFSECVAHTGIENFHVLPIGAAKPQDAGLLSPKALRNLVARAREEYDVVLIDTGPCLGSLEASMAAAESDATVLIVSRGDSKAMAVKAKEHLTSVGANVVGCVFNHALDTDLSSSSFASIVSQERRTDPAQSLLSADPAVAARFGPLGSAVAAFGTPSKSPNGRPRRAPSANGNGSSNGH